MINLERINEILNDVRPVHKVTGEDCVDRIQVMQSAYVPDEKLRCRDCNNHNQKCYRPVKSFEIPLNYLRFKP